MRVIVRVARVALFATVLCLLAGAVQAEIPEKFSNLKLFPQDIGKQQLVDTMRAFSTGLGVRCTFCHLQETPGDFDSFDFASDELKHKQVAREMMKMVGQINGELLPAAIGPDRRVSCVTCHRGLPDPATLEEVLLGVAGEKGADAAVTRYRELREQYYGSGSYDFSPGSLMKVAESLAQSKKDPVGARAMVELNLEVNPEHVDSFLMLAQLQAQAGQTAEAMGSLEKALKLDPGNRHAQRMLEQLK